MHAVKHNFWEQGRKPTGTTGFVDLGELFRRKEANPHGPWPLAGLSLDEIPPSFSQTIGKERQGVESV
jgi:hypothetical protein